MRAALLTSSRIFLSDTDMESINPISTAELDLLSRVAAGEFDHAESSPSLLQNLIDKMLVEKVAVFAYPILLTIRYRYLLTPVGEEILKGNGTSTGI